MIKFATMAGINCGGYIRSPSLERNVSMLPLSDHSVLNADSSSEHFAVSGTNLVTARPCLASLILHSVLPLH